jgi:electron transport complex protein RnfG
MAKKLENSLKNMFFSLTGISLVVGALLGWVYGVTEQPIAQANEAKQTNAIKAVAPSFDTVGEAIEGTSANGKPSITFPVYKDGAQVGSAVQVTTAKGFGGDVTIMFGFDNEGNITGYNCLAMAETPGLGSKMPIWFVEGGKGNVIGKNPGKNNLTVSKDGGEVDAITAATISSRAFCDAIAQAYGILTNTDAQSAATPQVAGDEAAADAEIDAPAVEQEVADGIEAEEDNSNNQ